MQHVQVMMLAAGFGSRLWPLTADRGKPAVPFLGRPLIRGMVDWLKSHGIKDIVVNTHHQPESIQNALNDISPLDVRLKFSHEEEILGTAGCLAAAIQKGLLAKDRTTLIVNAKLVTNIDLMKAMQTHKRAQNTVTMVLRPNINRENFTSVHVDKNNVVSGFGSPRQPEGPNPLLFTGIHFLEPSVLQKAKVCFSDTIKDLYPPEIEKRRVGAHVDQHGQWAEFSTLERYLSLQLDAVSTEPVPHIHTVNGCDISSDADVSHTIAGENVKIGPTAQVHQTTIWKNATVDGQVQRCILGEGVKIHAEHKIKDQVVVRRSTLGDIPEAARPMIKLEDDLAFIPLNWRSS